MMADLKIIKERMEKIERIIEAVKNTIIVYPHRTHDAWLNTMKHKMDDKDALEKMIYNIIGW